MKNTVPTLSQPDPVRRPREESYLLEADALADAYPASFAAAVQAYREASHAAERDLSSANRACPSVKDDRLPCDCHAARDAYDQARDAAWKQLGQAVASDPLAAWIVATVALENLTEVLEALAVMPCPIERLDALADQGGWCEAYARYRAAAEAAGLIAPTADAVTR